MSVDYNNLEVKESVGYDFMGFSASTAEELAERINSYVTSQKKECNLWIEEVHYAPVFVGETPDMNPHLRFTALVKFGSSF